jgi:exonuclease VII small subunit
MHPAYADDDASSTTAAPSEEMGGIRYSNALQYRSDLEAAQKKIEDSAKAYDDACARVSDLEQRISDNKTHLSEISSHIDDRYAAASASMVRLYKMQREGCSAVDVLVGSQSLNDFATSMTYIEYMQQRASDDLSSFDTTKQDLESTEQDLEDAYQQVQDETARAQQTLADAQQAREDIKNSFIVEASTQGSSQGESVIDDSIDWSLDKDAFISEWAARIDRYLAGSPLEGQGESFADAAWQYGVDPRWSPAISNTESSKGAICFLPHNAWGWGDVSWGSWDEAIHAHVAGLAKGYGYTISYDAASKYCPPNTKHWYESTLQQMQTI